MGKLFHDELTCVSGFLWKSATCTQYRLHPNWNPFHFSLMGIGIDPSGARAGPSTEEFSPSPMYHSFHVVSWFLVYFRKWLWWNKIIGMRILSCELLEFTYLVDAISLNKSWLFMVCLWRVYQWNYLLSWKHGVIIKYKQDSVIFLSYMKVISKYMKIFNIC